MDERLLLELCAHACPESQTLDFKRDLPGRDNKSRAEFLKEVCALANADGGDLVYGLNEKNAKASSPHPIVGEPTDAAERRLAQILEAGIEPRVVGVRFHAAPISGGYALVVRVSPSFSGPHRYLSNGNSRFVVRAGTHTVELSYDQLRSAFDRTATLFERARRFREERLARIVAGNTWGPITAGPICVVHLVPVTSMAGKVTIDIQNLHSAYTPFMFSDWGGASRSMNLDGLVVHPGGAPEPGQEAYAYTQVFRSGALEAVRYGGRTIDDRKVIPSITIAAFFRDAIRMFLAAAVTFNISGPGVLSAALLRIGEHRLGFTDYLRFSVERPSDRPDLIFPETWIERVEAPGDPDIPVRALLDTLWQSFDVERCTLFDKDGNWIGR